MNTTQNAVKLYAVIPIATNRLPDRKATSEGKPLFCLRPMNHAAACNWMQACRNEFTDYRLIEWPADVAAPGAPIIADDYRKDCKPSIVRGVAIITPAKEEKKEWQRMARAAYSAGKNSVGHTFSTAASLAENEAFPVKRFDELQSQYRAWLCFGEWPAQ